MGNLPFELEMRPAAGHRMVRHAGDVATFFLGVPEQVRGGGKDGLPAGWRARLRTNLGRAETLRWEVVRSHYQKLPLAGASWQDLPMEAGPGGWHVAVPLTEVGYFKAKPYLLDAAGVQHWPSGPDIGIQVAPSWTRTANTIYCAFPRMFGRWSKEQGEHRSAHDPVEVRELDTKGWVVIPPSGTLRDLQEELPHIIDTLGCRIVHLLPVGPVPTTYARFGRFGSPYAVQDLTAIDPALVVFDRRTTGVDQFRELVAAIHDRGARVFLDMVINHTGWGSREWNDHPEWFLRDAAGTFESPGAWGVVWEDLVEFDQQHVALWDYLAGAFLEWCRRGVDGFRCDAGYKVPVHVWQYITARVRQEYPDTVFLLEGLGGPWEATEALLTDGGMQWAYSELFQNQSAESVGGYLDHHLRASFSSGVLVHYSETHDNARLAAHPLGLAWSRQRNRLCALTSVNGGFGFTCGVEWGATEQINVHSSRGLNWGAPVNLVAELARLNRLLAEHPCFFDGARLTRVSPEGSIVHALRRDSAEGADALLVLVNTDVREARRLRLGADLWAGFCATGHDLLVSGEDTPAMCTQGGGQGWVEIVVDPGAVHCLAPSRAPRGLAGDAYRCLRAQADWGLRAWVNGWRVSGGEDRPVPLPAGEWMDWGRRVAADPQAFLAATLGVEGDLRYRPVVEWTRADCRRVLLVPAGHWLLVRETCPFRARLVVVGADRLIQEASIPAGGGHVAAFTPRMTGGDAVLEIERQGVGLEEGVPRREEVRIRFVDGQPEVGLQPGPATFHGPLVLLTNGRGGMARIPLDLGRVTSKYDCVLGANLHAEVPVDRHVFIKRLRVWVNADGFITPLNAENLVNFEPGPPAHWRFVANAGNGRSVEIHLVADMPEGRNEVLLQFSRPSEPASLGRPLPPEAFVRLTVRLDLEDRGFHCETKHHPGLEAHFLNHLTTAPDGFTFRPAPDREVRVTVVGGVYRPEGEWSFFLGHPVEATRGMEGSGDAYSPGWFDLPLIPGATVTVTASAEAEAEAAGEGDSDGFVVRRVRQLEQACEKAGVWLGDRFARQLVTALQAFVVRRGKGRTVIAGYPWFLDWGRDSLIAARGLIAAGMREEVRELLRTFARFEKGGTLPNSIHGEDASNRDTSDAPLWLGVVCEEYAAAAGDDETSLYAMPVGDPAGRDLGEILRSIACGYLTGTTNGIRVDLESGLVWSPGHFTWMDTNHPAGTPREGYPVEIQVLWIRLLRQLARLGLPAWERGGRSWQEWATLAQASFEERFWIEEAGWYADCLPAGPGAPAATAPVSNALRSNCLLAVALDIATGGRAVRTVRAAWTHLVVPGALRSLAPLPVTPPLPVVGNDGCLLNDPQNPYWGRYEGDEDTRRKPAYHNGTAWGWTFPGFCEALAKAHGCEPAAVAAARACLGSMDRHFSEGCLGQMPEVVDGDAPHTHRGCDAQAWTITEALRVWRWLETAGA